MDRLAPTMAPSRTRGNLRFHIMDTEVLGMLDKSICSLIKGILDTIILKMSPTLTLAVPIAVNKPIKKINAITNIVIIRLYLLVFAFNFITSFYSKTSG